MLLTTSPIQEKIRRLPSEIHRALLGTEQGGSQDSIPRIPARDVAVVPITALPDKRGFSTSAGQARLLHDLASIELQAMELAFRTLIEFPDAPPEFRHQLAELTLDEGRHLELCLQGLQNLGFPWGTWPVHLALWESVRAEDSLLDRLLIVHRYLEGSGLDAGETLLRRLAGVDSAVTRPIVATIVEEEVGHVDFGSRWYRHFCQVEGHDPDLDFRERLTRLRAQLPRRREPISHDLRKKAGFTEREIQTLETVRSELLSKLPSPQSVV